MLSFTLYYNVDSELIFICKYSRLLDIRNIKIFIDFAQYGILANLAKVTINLMHVYSGECRHNFAVYSKN